MTTLCGVMGVSGRAGITGLGMNYEPLISLSNWLTLLLLLTTYLRGSG